MSDDADEIVVGKRGRILSKLSEGAIGAVFLAIFLWLQFGGIYHAFSRHPNGDGIASVLIPPWAWYRSIEYFWHDWHSESEWTTILSDDAWGILALASADKSDPQFVIDRPAMIKKLRSRVRHYPTGRKDRLRTIVDVSAKWLEQSSRGIILVQFGTPADRRRNEEARGEAQAQLVKVVSDDLYQWLKTSASEADTAFGLIADASGFDPSNIDPDKLRDLLETIEASIDARMGEYQRIKRSIFDSE